MIEVYKQAYLSFNSLLTQASNNIWGIRKLLLI